MRQLKKNLPYLVLLAIFVVIAYGNSLFNGFVSDDKITLNYLLDNGLTKSIQTRPFAFMQFLMLYLAYKIGGLNPILYRLPNIIFHIGAVWTVFLLITFLKNTSVAFFTALIFAVHPIVTESVTWISGGPYVRYSFFFLLSFYLYIRFKDDTKRYITSLILFAVSLLISEKAIVASFIFFLYEISLGSVRNYWKKVIPYFGLAGLWALLYLLQLGSRFEGLEVQNYSTVKVLNPLIQIPVAITSYLQLLFWPDKLTLYHSEMSFGIGEYVIRLLVMLGILGGLGVLWKKNRQIFFWLMFFIISLLPTLTPFGVSWIVAERYVYLGSIGVIAIFSYLLSVIVKNKKTEVIGYLLFVVIILGLMARTIMRNFDWKNEDTLWIATGEISPSDPKTHNNLGDVYGRWGDLQRSAEEFKIAIQLNPRYADAYHNLGNTYQQMGSPSAALENYLLATKYNQNLWQSYQNIAAIYFEEQKYEEAIRYMKEAIKVFPNHSFLYSNLGVIYFKQGDKTNAKMAFETALKLDPTNQQAQSLLKLISQ